MRLGLRFVLFAAVLIVGGAPSSAGAHPLVAAPPASMLPPPAPDRAAGVDQTVPRSAPVGLPTLSTLLAAMMVVPRLRRRLRPLVLVLLVAVAGAEGAIHSVHHLSDATGAERCPVATSAEHVSAAAVGVTPSLLPMALALEPVPIASPLVVRGGAPVRLAGRSPPA